MGGIKQYDEKKWIYFSFNLEYDLIKEQKIIKKWKWNELTKPHFDKTKNSVGIITGEKSNLLILDYDNKNHWEEDIKNNPELLNYYVKTNRGYHSYFLYSDGLNNISTDLKNNNIDLQGNKKFIIGPPSKYKIDNEIIKYKIKSNNNLKFLSNDLINYMVEKYNTNEEDIKNDEKTNNDIIKMGNLINIKYLDNYDDWLKIIWSLKSENLYEEAKVISSRSKKYDAETFDKFYNSNIDNKISIGTFNYYVKHSNHREYERINKKNKKTELKTNFNLTNLKSKKYLADVYYSKNKNKYILSDSGWYEYNKYNILKYKCDLKDYPHNLINDLSEQLLKYLNEEYDKLDEDKILLEKEYNKIVISFNDSSFLEGVRKFLKNLYFVEDFENKINKNNNLLCFNNKVYDYEIKKIRDVKPDDYITITTGYDAPIKKDEKIIKEIDNLLWSIFEDQDMIEYYKVINSISLFNNKLQSLFLHCGTGGNGKGVLCSILDLCLGEYFGVAENTFLTSTYKAGTPNQTLYQSKDKRYLSLSEPDNGQAECKFNIDLIKNLTGGDKITTRGLYKNNITYEPKFLINIQCNNKPDLGNLDKGILRRFKIINYKFNFVDNPKFKNEKLRDYDLIDKVKSQDFINNFIIMLIEKAEEYKDVDIKKIKIPESVKAETKDYIQENNPVLSFIENKLIITNDDNDKIKTADMVKMYNTDEDNERQLTQKDFHKYFKFNNFVIKKTKGIRYYIGCKKKETEQLMDIEEEEDELNMIY